MPDKIVLVPPELAGLSMERQFPVAMAAIIRELQSINAHQGAIENTLSGNGHPSYESVREYQEKLRKEDAVEAVQWTNQFRKDIRQFQWGLTLRVVGATITGVVLVIIALAQAGVI